MAAKGFNAGRVYLQVVPSYKRFMEILRKDSDGILGKAISSELADRMEKNGYSSGAAYGSGVQRGINKTPIKTDKLTRDLQKGLQKSLDDGGKHVNKYRSRITALNKAIDKNGNATAGQAREAKKLAREMHIASQNTENAARKQGLLNGATAISTEAVRQHRTELVQNTRATAKSEQEAARLAKTRQKNVVQDKATRDAQKNLTKAIDDGGEHTRVYHERIKELKGQIRDEGRVTDKHSRQIHGLASEMTAAADRTDNLTRRQGLLNGAMALNSNETRRYQRTIRGMERSTDRAGQATSRLTRRHREGAKASKSASRGLGKLRNMLIGVRGDTNDGANAFRFFNAGIMAMMLLGPGLIPILGAIAGGLALIGSMAVGVGAGFGVAALGLSGIAGAVKAMSAKQKETSHASGASKKAKSDRSAGKRAQKDARDQVVSARAIADARRSLKDAYRSSAESINSALESQKRAEQGLAQAQKDAKKAQEDLSKARRDAKKELVDLDDQVKQNKLDERQAVIDLFNAHNTYGATMADGGATNLEKEQSDIGLKQAQLNLKRVREQETELAKKKSHADKTGINGTKGVKDAEETVTRALDKQRDARKSLADAVKDTAKTRADADRSIADAKRSLSRAIEDAQYRSETNAAAMDDAANSADTATAATNNLADAMKKLSPAGKRFAKFIYSLGPGLDKLRFAAQEGFLPGLQEGMELIINKYGPGFTSWVSKTAKQLGSLSKQAAEGLAGPQWEKYFAAFSKSSDTFIEQFGRTLGGLGTGLATFFEISMPYAERFATAIGDASQKFAHWADSAAGRKSIKGFFEYTERVGPKIGKFMSAFVGAIRDIGKALSPIGESVLENLTKMFQWMSKADPKLVALIAGGFLAIMVALQASAGIVAFISLLTIITGANMLLAVSAIISLATGLWFLGNASGDAGKSFRKFMDSLSPVLDILKDVWHMVKDQMVKTFNESLLPAIKSITGAIEKDLLPSLKRFWPVVRPLVKFLVFVFGTVLRGLINGVKDLVLGVIKIISGVMDVITGIFTGDFGLVLDGLKKIFLGTIQAIWGYFNVMLFGRILGVFKLFGKGLFGFLKKLFSGRILGMLKTFGSTMLKIIKAPLEVLKFNFKVALFLIKGFFKGLFAAAKFIFKGIGKVFSTLGKAGLAVAKWLGRSFKWIGGKIAGFGKGVWGVLKKVGGFFKNMLTKPINGLKKFIDTFITRLLRGLGRMKDKIGGILKSIGGFFGKKLGNPIITVVDAVLNKGIIKGINKVAGFVGLHGKDGKGILGKIKMRKKFNQGGVAGVMPGYTPGRDNQTIQVGGGEAILRPEVTKGLGKETISALNNSAVRGGVNAVKKLAGFSRGGIVGGKGGFLDIFKRVWPANTKRLSSSYPGHSGVDIAASMGSPIKAASAGTIAHTGYGRGFGNAVFSRGIDGLLQIYGHGSKVLSHVGQKVKAGQRIANVGSTGHSTGPHLHFEIARNAPGTPSNRAATFAWLKGAKLTPGGGGKADNSILSKLKGLGKGALGAVKDPGSFFGKRLKGIFNKLPISGKLLDMAKAIPKKLMGSIVKWLKKKAFGLLGLPGKAFKAGVSGFKHFFGFGGGKGGMGGRYNGAKTYDAGGRIPPGVTTVINKSNKPEALLNNEQWSKLLSGRGGSSNDTYYMNAYGSDATAATRQLAADLQRARRRMKNSGTLTRKVN